MSENDEGPGRNTWEFETPDAGLVRGDRPTDAGADRPTTTDPVPPAGGVPERGRRRVSRRHAYLLWVALASVAAVVVVVFALAVSGDDEDPQVAVSLVPNLIDLAQSDAIALLETEGLVAGTITGEVATDAEVGRVLEQRPAAGAEAEVASAVDLVIATAAGTVAVPAVIGLTEDAAAAALQEAGLVNVMVESVSSEAADEGTVTAQRPDAETEVAPDAAITIEVAAGPPSERVPNVAGLDAAAAVRTLEGVGWVVQRVDLPHETVADGAVIETEPAARTEVVLGETIVVRVSTGRPIVVVPDVLGQNALESTAALQQIGLQVRTSSCTVKNTEKYPPGTIRRQEPEAGVEVEPGSVVITCVAVAEPTPTPAPVPTATPRPRQTPSQPPPPTPTRRPTPRPELDDCAPDDPSCS